MKTFYYGLSMILFGIAILLGVGSVLLLIVTIKDLFYGYGLGLLFLVFIGWASACAFFSIVASFLYTISKPESTIKETLTNGNVLFKNRNIYHDTITGIVVGIVMYLLLTYFKF